MRTQEFKNLIIIGMSAILFPMLAFGQETKALKDIQLSKLAVGAFFDGNHNSYKADRSFPLVDFDLNGITYRSSLNSGWNEKIAISFNPDSTFSPGFMGIISFKNISNDTITLSNVVPFGRNENKVYITGMGNNPLSRTHLFLPGRKPVNVIVPDNAWELGFSESSLQDSLFVCALVRRYNKGFKDGSLHRFETVLYPGSEIKYHLYADFYTGKWQNGLRIIFQKRYLYDVTHFDDSLFNRKALKWIRDSYVVHLLMAWDKQVYDIKDGQYHLINFLRKGLSLYGGDDVVGIWPTWPSLGIDQRNQFDLFRDLPGGLSKIRSLVDSCHSLNTSFFICYNPWDESTRGEGHLSGLADIIKETNADGVVLDTRGASSLELQKAADSVKKGIVMYSEGMAVPRDMQGIVAGRVHNALYYPPMLNLNKFIKPEFAIFRVTEVYKEPIRREFSLAFFNGYGTEINMFAPGIPSNLEDEYKYLGRTTRILRENHFNFISKAYTPLIPTNRDSIWVNAWPLPTKTIYTIYSILPGGYKGYLFKIPRKKETHLVDIWHHRELTVKNGRKFYSIPAQTDAFNASWLGTNNEGAVDCIAQFPNLLQTSLIGDILSIKADSGTAIKIWAGKPAYDRLPVSLAPGYHTVHLNKLFGRYEGKFVIQLFKDNILIDENVFEIAPGTPRLISSQSKTPIALNNPKNMILIPADTFRFHTTHGDDFIPYPSFNEDSLYHIPSFYIDKTPVTNHQFELFLKATHYKPQDTSNFLKNWNGTKTPNGMENYPVVYISYEDAKAYAKWAGKRLPTEVEWQYAAQTPDLNEWPWKQTTPVKWTSQVITNTLTVKRLNGIDSSNCNLGDGKLYSVGKYQSGANPYGLLDLVGCVWQLTNDIYQSGSYRYIMMKGGSYFNPSSSWWYVQGGPRPLTYRQYLLRVSPGFERNSTVGFRCVKDTQ